MCVTNFMTNHPIVEKLQSGQTHCQPQSLAVSMAKKLIKFYIMHRLQHLGHTEKKNEFSLLNICGPKSM